MNDYERTVEFWQLKNIINDAELAQVLNGYGIAFAYRGRSLNH